MTTDDVVLLAMFGTELSDAGWDVNVEELFDTMARLDHPDAESVLNHGRQALR